MTRVVESKKISPQTAQHIGVAVHSSGKHIGVLFRDSKQGLVYLLHLAFHEKLRCDVPKPEYSLWVRPVIPADRAMAIGAFCRRIWKLNQVDGLPYGFSHPNDFFEQTGKALEGPARVGLTCATFVVAVFQGAGFPLIQCETWPSATVEDISQREEVLGQLPCDTLEHSAHLVAARRELGNVRYRPLDVAGGAACEILPAWYEAAVEKGKLIAAILQS